MLLKDLHTVNTQRKCATLFPRHSFKLWQHVELKILFFWNAHHVDIHHYYSYPFIILFIHSCKQISNTLSCRAVFCCMDMIIENSDLLKLSLVYRLEPLNYMYLIRLNVYIKPIPLKKSVWGNLHNNGSFLRIHEFHLSLYNPWNSSIVLLKLFFSPFNFSGRRIEVILLL